MTGKMDAENLIDAPQKHGVNDQKVHVPQDSLADQLRYPVSAEGKIRFDPYRLLNEGREVVLFHEKKNIGVVQRRTDILAEHGTYLVPTIIASRIILDSPQAHVPEFMLYKARIAAVRHKEVVQTARKEGVKFAFGTDAGSICNDHGDQAREFAYLMEYGLTTMEALCSATINAAELLHMKKEVGSLEAGKYADIVAFDGNPFEDITVMQHPDFVMKGGTVYKENGTPVYGCLL